jgi:hypothetical protein
MSKKRILSTYEIALNEEERIKQELERKISQMEKMEGEMIIRLKQLGRVPKIVLGKAQ